MRGRGREREGEGRKDGEAVPPQVWSGHGEKSKVRQGDWPTPEHPASSCGLPGQCSLLTPYMKAAPEVPDPPLCPCSSRWYSPPPTSCGPTIQRDFSVEGLHDAGVTRRHHTCVLSGLQVPVSSPQGLRATHPGKGHTASDR